MGSEISETDAFRSFFNSEIIGRVMNTQTTYLDLEMKSSTQDKVQYRVHFDQKQEFRLERKTFSRISVTSGHPLLIDYDEVTVDVHLSGMVERKSEFADALESTALHTFGNWRSYDRYLNISLDRFLERTYGVLMTAPESFANKVVDLAPFFAVTLFPRNERAPKGEFKVLLMDELYVVARDFRFQLMVNS